MAQVERDVFDHGQLVLDERQFPVVVATWDGQVTEDGIEAYFRWYDRVLRRAAIQGIKLMPVTDLSGVEGTVELALRRRFVEEFDRREAMTGDFVDQMMVVAQEAYVLGLVAFVLCNIRQGVRLSSFGRLESALGRALVRLDTVGVQRPAWLESAEHEPANRPRAVA